MNNALTQCQTARAKTDLRIKQIEAMERAVESTELLMQHSSTTYLEVLTLHSSRAVGTAVSRSPTSSTKIQGVVNLYQGTRRRP